MSCIQWFWSLLVTLTEGITCVCILREQKDSRKKDILKKADMNGVLCKTQMWCNLYLFYVRQFMQETENASGDEKQHGRERGTSKATKVEKPEEVY